MKQYKDFKRINQYDLPEIIDPERICVCFEIPNERYHIRAFWTALYRLTLWNSWEADDDKTGTKVAAVWRDVWNKAIGDENTVGCGCNEPKATNRRYNDYWENEVSYDDGITWVVDNSNDPRFTGSFAPPIAGENGLDKMCVAAASGRVVFEEDLIQVINESSTWNALYALLLALMIPLTGIAAPPLAAIITGVIWAFGTAAVQAAFTVGVFETYECILYCRMKPDGSFDEAGWKGVIDDIYSQLTGIAATVLAEWVKYIGVVGLTNTVRSGRASENDCSECGCDDAWCYVFDFAENDGDWQRFAAAGVLFGAYDIGTGWSYSDATNVQTGITTAHRQLLIERIFDASILTRVLITYDFTGGSYDNASLTALGVSLDSDAVITIPRSGMVDGNGQTAEWTAAGEEVGQIRITLRSSRDVTAPLTYSGNALIKSVRIEGVGVNPFGEDNCP